MNHNVIVYLANCFEDMTSCCWWIRCILIMFLIFSLFFDWKKMTEKQRDGLGKTLDIQFWTVIVLSLVLCFIPSREELYSMHGLDIDVQENNHGY